MKIAIASDIHLEMSTIELKNTQEAKILILAGDIFVAKELTKYDPKYEPNYDVYQYLRSYNIHNFFLKCSKQFDHVIFVAGNHEHYHGDVEKTLKHIKNNLGHIKNLHILDNESIEIDDIKFVGGTLWTNMNNDCDSSKEVIKKYMSDFRIIRKGNYKYTPDDAMHDHIDSLYYFNNELQSDKKTVVITHHAPSILSIADQFKDDEFMNGGYYSDLNKFIEDRPFISTWIHGHTHNKCDYIIGNTRIMCNPRGYKGETAFDEFELEYVEI